MMKRKEIERGLKYMSQYDRENLIFLMTSSPEQLEKWFNNVEDDDIIYALELLQLASIDLDMQMAELYDDKRIDVTLANNYLKKFMLDGDNNGRKNI